MKLFYKNEYLFSEIYLKEITQIEEDPAVKATLASLKEYRDYANASNLSAWNESFVHEILNALKFGVRKIDSNTALLNQFGSNEIITLCYSLLPQEDLNSTLMGQNWSEKIIRSLKENNLKWGILTNGDQWQIYHTEEPTPYENYLEIALKEIMDAEDVQQYQIFNKFMRAENFVNNNDGNCQFDLFKKESHERINYIEEEFKNALKQKEEGGKGILSNICMGYVDYLRENEDPNFSDESLRDTIYSSAMLYMFRLLFLFYAKARGLLKESNQELFSDVLQAAQKAQEQGRLEKNDYSLWNNLRELFSNIDLTYNGGLFNPTENEFVEEKRLSNRYLAPVIYFMTFYEDKAGNQVPISYRDMGVRHLGSLYEGLLEHKLFIAEENTEVKVGKNEVKFIPVSKGGKLVKGRYIPTGRVYFGNDKGIRKESGSYYTPEYIVDYIVQNTVGQKLEEYENSFLKKNKDLIGSIRTAINANEKTAFTELLNVNIEKFIHKKILEFSVLDPAMGSGHFLVNATNLISNFITSFSNRFQIVRETETSTTYWRRRVVENCLFGVDINPLAVELAKLSLWILSMAKRQPLSFLDHHLKCGNSLIGTKLMKIGKYPTNKRTSEKAQIGLFYNYHDFELSIEQAIAKYQQIQLQETKALDDIGDKKQWLDDVNKILSPYKKLCNFHVDTYFNNDISEEKYNEIILSFNENFNWNGNLYFHWELEFPEVFFNKLGFDCVIGNPPYVGVDEEIYRISIEKTINTKNLFCYFSEVGMHLTNSVGCHSFIVPLSGFAMKKMTPYQSVLLDQSLTLKFINFSWRPGKIFKDVNIPVTVFVARKKEEDAQEIESVKTTHYLRWYNDEKGAPLNKIIFVESKKYLSVSPGFIPKIGADIEIQILDKMLINPKLEIFVTKKNLNPNNLLYYRSKGGLYYKIFTNFNAGSSNEIAFSCANEANNLVLMPILNSNIFYWFYELFSSCRVVSFENICCLPLDLDKVAQIYGNKFIKLSEKLINDIKKNATINIRNYANYGEKECYTIYMRKSMPILVEIDTLLGKYYGFTEKELHYLSNYMIRYRGDKN